MKRQPSTIFLALIATAALGSNAFAAPKAGTAVYDAQHRLAQLGYDSGPVDGVVGYKTATALMDFQARNGLKVTGKLTPETGHLLRQADAVMANGYYTGARPVINVRGGYHADAYLYNNVQPAGVAAWTPHGRTLWSQPVPTRFARVALNEDRYSGSSNYSVTVNGAPVLLASNQTVPVRISKTFHMNGEDAVIVTSMDGAAGCKYRSYLLSVRSDGSAAAPRELGNCSGGYEVTERANGLLIRFPSGQYATSNTMWHTWSYSGQRLGQI